MFKLWSKQQEEDFFIKSLEFASPEQLFYLSKDKKYYAYWPKHYKGIKATLQSRNSLIGHYTEKWASELFHKVGELIGGYSVQHVVCEEIGLTKKSSADVAICKTREIVQRATNILLVIEVKMSVVWNWELILSENKNYKLTCTGDYRTHQGNPGLLRSDTMLKAIGKSINVRVSSPAASRIPIIIIGNTPIAESYYEKVDHLKRNGIVQGFWSINPNPLDDNGENIKNTKINGFYRFDSYDVLEEHSLDLLKEDREFFSSMKSKENLGKIIEIANREVEYEKKAQKFLELLREGVD